MSRHVYYYTHVGVPFVQAAAVLCGPPAAWLPLAPGGVVRIDTDGALPREEEPVMLRLGVGERHTSGDQVVASLEAAPLGDSPTPPFLGELTLTALRGDASQLAFLGAWRAPAEVSGGELIARQVVQAVVRGLLKAVAEQLRSATVNV